MLLSRRPARDSDVPFLLDLRAQTMHSYELAVGIDPTPARNEARVMAHFESAEIVECEGQAIGILKVVREPLHWYLVQIQLLPSHQGRGIGGKLVESVLIEARRHGVPVKLSVLKSNRARQLYERLGFRVVSEGAHEYQMQAEV